MVSNALRNAQKNYRLLIHGYSGCSLNFSETIKNPLSQVACGFKYVLGFLLILMWYRGSESNRHSLAGTGF